MNGYIARKARDPGLRFVSIAYLIHFATLVLAFYVRAGMNPLINPVGIFMTVLAAGNSASAGPAIHARTGSL